MLKIKNKNKNSKVSHELHTKKNLETTNATKAKKSNFFHMHIVYTKPNFMEVAILILYKIIPNADKVSVFEVGQQSITAIM